MKKYQLLSYCATVGFRYSSLKGYQWVRENYNQQMFALQNPHLVRKNGRIGAIIATKDFDYTQVGAGAHIAIRGIHLFFRNIGEQEIGTVFFSPEVQEILRLKRTMENNRRLGCLEYEYWISQKNSGNTYGDKAMIFWGSNVGPDARAILQEASAVVGENYSKLINFRNTL